LNDGVDGGRDFGRTPRSIEVLNRLNRIAVLADTQTMAHRLIEIDEHPIPEKIVHFVLTRVMTRAQPPDRINLIGSIMIDVHAGILLRPLNHPINESLKGKFFFFAVMCPPVIERQRAGLPVH
jgi:hypothetical protein